MMKRYLLAVVALGLGLGVSLPFLLAQRPGVLRPTVFAIRDARVVAEPGKVLPQATVVIRDGLIEAVGADVKAPPEALTIDGKGLTVYPGFIDAMSNWGLDLSLQRSESGAPAAEDLASEALAVTKPDNRKGLTPEFLVSTALRTEEEQAESWRRAGFTARLIAPESGIIIGQSALASLSGAPPREAVLRSPVAMHVSLRTVPGSDYPRSLMGVVAHFRQTLLDAGHYQRIWAAYEKNGRAGRRPPLDPCLADLGPVLAGKLPVVFEADTRDSIHRALDLAREFNLRPILYGGKDAYRVADRIQAEKVAVLLRINFTDQPQAGGGRRGGPPAAPTPPVGRGRGRGNLPETPATPPGSPSAAEPEAERPALPQRVREDNERRQKEEIRSAAVLNKQGTLFAFSTQGQSGNQPADRFRENLRKVIAEGLSPDAALQALTIDAARILGVERQMGTITPGKAAHLVVMNGDFHEARTQVRHVFADGAHFEYDSATRTAAKPADARKPEEAKKPEATASADQTTEIEADRKPKTRTGGNVLIRGATVLTVTNGSLPKTDILVREGKIAKVGPNLPPTDGVTVIDAEGMFVMPGIIDTHSHFAIAGGVNETSLSVVPEVRVRDVIDGDDVQIYRALAGGVTLARLLHGSANVVGGQDAVIKLKYGEAPSKLLLADAPRGVKFALGENVKRTDGRFPNTRLGVEAVLVRAFTEAQIYRQMWDNYEKSRQEGNVNPPIPEPRRDLRLEALADVLKGDLKVHSHCYRADEILMLLRVADRFGFKVKSLQHVLEGYKIAPEIAAHGASNSTFSDWWAYKIEAYDAIPFNAALMHEAGAEVCLKSDSNELMRHLYQEAAKCVKYGGMSETEALKTITINGAKQLGLESRIGSIDVGKDADLAIFNGHPLNSYARCEMTLVDGEVYFQRSDRLIPDPMAAAGPSLPVEEVRSVERSKNGRYVLQGVMIHPVVGKPYRGSVVIDGGKIVSVLKNGQEPPRGDAVVVTPASWWGGSHDQRLSSSDLHVYPGMIDAATVLGLTELGSARETQDFAEGGDFQPDLRASTAINPDSELIPVTRANGVTTVVTRPSGSIIAGQGALINLAGWVPREMAIVDPLALHIEFPSANPLLASSDPTAPAVGRAIARRQRDEKIRRLKELFQQATAYDDARKQSPEKPANPRLEALVPYARGQKPVIIQANRRQEILDALKLADDLKLKVILSGTIDAWKVADELKKRDVPVIVGPMMAMPAESYDPYDAPYALPARLHEAGVKFAIRSGGTTNTRNLPYEAAMAISYGLPPEEGLKAVTLYPAQILGVADQLGSIEEGKRANLVLTNGDLLQASTQVLSLFIDGRPLSPENKQTRLYDRYRERLQEVKDGRAPLGTR